MTGALLTVEELAERLAISPRTVIELARTGRIPEIRLGPRTRRFDFEAVLSAVKGGEARSEGKPQ